MSLPDDHAATPAGQAAQDGDPTMEDILASIRRILSEEETGPAAPEASAEHGEDEQDVFVLDPSMMVPERKPEPLPAAPPPSPAAPAHAAPARSPSRSPAVYGGGPTLEDMVRDAIRPLVREWLDANLPELAERVLQSEIGRVVPRSEP